MRDVSARMAALLRTTYGVVSELPDGFTPRPSQSPSS
jgi:hypothetical protein